jgi:hypothetical protein
MPKSNHSMALPSEAAFTARFTAVTSVTVMSDRRSLGFLRRWMVRNSMRWRLTAAGSVVAAMGRVPFPDLDQSKENTCSGVAIANRSPGSLGLRSHGEGPPGGTAQMPRSLMILATCPVAFTL